VPDGIDANKRSLARRGGFAALALAGAVALCGGAILALTDGAFFGVIGFMAVAFGVPLLPIVGIPARSGGVRWAIAIVGSAGMWWWVGQLSAARVRKMAVAGWSDWAKEVGLYVGAVFVGVVGAILIAAKAMGAL
jgi:hypothetical protein